MGFVVKLVLALAVVAAGIWAWTMFMPKQAVPVVQEQEVQAPVEQKPQTVADSIRASGSSDASLQADLQSLDAQVESAQSAQTGVEQSFNDKPVQQTE